MALPARTQFHTINLTETTPPSLNIEAYAIAKSAQKIIKEHRECLTDLEASIEALGIVREVNGALDRLEKHRLSLGSSCPSTYQSLYICESILLICRYKLTHQNLDLKLKIKQLLHILQHLSPASQENNAPAIATLASSTFSAKQ